MYLVNFRRFRVSCRIPVTNNSFNDSLLSNYLKYLTLHKSNDGGRATFLKWRHLMSHCFFLECSGWCWIWPPTKMNLIGFWGMDRQLHCRQYAFHNVSSNVKFTPVKMFYHKIFIVDHPRYATRQVEMRVLFRNMCLCFGQSYSLWLL